MMPRRNEIAAAVAAYNLAHPSDDVCQSSLAAIAADGFSARMLPGTLRRLVDAGFLTRQRGASRVPDTWRLHLPPQRQP